MRRWMGQALLAVALAAATACGSDSTGPSARGIATGAYHITIVHSNPAGFAPADVTYSGTLTITYATADSIAGRYDLTGHFVPTLGGDPSDHQYSGALAFGLWNVDAYLVTASTAGTLQIRLAGSGDAPRCTASARFLATVNGDYVTVPATCAVEGP